MSSMLFHSIKSWIGISFANYSNKNISRRQDLESGNSLIE